MAAGLMDEIEAGFAALLMRYGSMTRNVEKVLTGLDDANRHR
jgi:hypothetical protein